MKPNTNFARRLLITTAAATVLLSTSGASARAQTTTTKPGTAKPGTAKPGTANAGVGQGQPGAGRGGPNRAFCRQVTDSQAVIAAAKGDAVAKLGLTAAQWVKIESQAPVEIKPKVSIVRKAFQDATAARTNSAVKAQTVVDAGKAITTFVTANCSNRGGFGGGPNSAAFAAYQACLEKQGIKLPTPGAGQPPLNRNDAKVAAAMTACQDKLPAGAGAGGPGGGGRGFGAIRDCLAKKKITFQPGQGGGQAGAQLDAKTQKAIDDCRAEAAKATTTTTRKK